LVRLFNKKENKKQMKTLKKLRSIFKFQRKYGIVDNLTFFNNTSKNVKSPYRAKTRKPLKPLKFGINSVLINNNISNVLFTNLWKHSFRSTYPREKYFFNTDMSSHGDLQVQRYLKNLKQININMLLGKNKYIKKTYLIKN